ncbi:hypothetical protein TOPH_07617, partial [Tolypocladium ophioglossoides CBS 100239]
MSFGYINSYCETAIVPSPSSRYARLGALGFHHALDETEIKAIAVLLGDGTISSWVGEHENIPTWCLADDRGNSISSIKGEFDARLQTCFVKHFHLVFKPDSIRDSRRGISLSKHLSLESRRSLQTLAIRWKRQRLSNNLVQGYIPALSNSPIWRPSGEDLSELTEVVVWKL